MRVECVCMSGIRGDPEVKKGRKDEYIGVIRHSELDDGSWT